MPPPANLDFHLFALTPDSAAKVKHGDEPSKDGRLDVTSADFRAFDVSMETLGEQLSNQPRCYFEWDGSFVWTGDTAGQDWTLSGMIYDTGERISRVELRGTAPFAPVRQITQWLEIQPHELACQQMSTAAFISGLNLEKLFRA
ncbi:MAG: hypothetical protein Aurels2KO_18830 [Aureliella sp.]